MKFKLIGSNPRRMCGECLFVETKELQNIFASSKKVPDNFIRKVFQFSGSYVENEDGKSIHVPYSGEDVFCKEHCLQFATELLERNNWVETDLTLFLKHCGGFKMSYKEIW